MRLILALVFLLACVETPTGPDEAQRHSSPDPVPVAAQDTTEPPPEDTAPPPEFEAEALQKVDERIQTLRNEIASDRRL